MAKVDFKAIAKEVGVKVQGKKESDADFAERILTAVDKLNQKEWEKLSRGTQNWYNSFGVPAESADAGESESAMDLDSLDRKELERFIKDNDLTIKVVKSMTDDDIRGAIREVLGGPEEPEEPEEVPAPEEPEGDEFDGMTRNDLKIHIRQEELNIKVVKSMTDDDIRGAIREATEEEPEEPAEEEPEELEEPEGDEFDDMDRKALKIHIRKNDLKVKVMKSMTDDDIRQAIRLTDAPSAKTGRGDKTGKSAAKPATKKAGAKSQKNGGGLKVGSPPEKVFKHLSLAKNKKGVKREALMKALDLSAGQVNYIGKRLVSLGLIEVTSEDVFKKK